jgi:hypothetical protein
LLLFLVSIWAVTEHPPSPATVAALNFQQPSQVSLGLVTWKVLKSTSLPPGSVGIAGHRAQRKPARAAGYWRGCVTGARFFSLVAIRVRVDAPA